MSRINGVGLDCVYNDLTDEQRSRLKLDLRSCLETMRSWEPPVELRGMLCSTTGGPVWGHRIPPHITGPWDSEAAFIVNMVTRYDTSPENAAAGALVREIPTRPHRIVLTHGDLWHHNILVDKDGRLVAIIDWATAAWMPEWWEYAVSARLRHTWWSDIMLEVGGDQYEWELTRDSHLLEFHADSYSIF
jgi:hypothetical protein